MALYFDNKACRRPKIEINHDSRLDRGRQAPKNNKVGLIGLKDTLVPKADSLELPRHCTARLGRSKPDEPFSPYFNNLHPSRFDDCSDLVLLIIIQLATRTWTTLPAVPYKRNSCVEWRISHVHTSARKRCLFSARGAPSPWP